MSPIAPVEPINRVNASRYVVTRHSCQGLTTNPCAEPDRRCIRSFDYMVVSDVLYRSWKSLLARLTHISMTRLPRCSPVGSHAYSFRVAVSLKLFGFVSIRGPSHQWSTHKKLCYSLATFFSDLNLYSHTVRPTRCLCIGKYCIAFGRNRFL